MSMPPLDRILAPFLMGTVLNVFQYGIIVNQSYLYYVWYKRDKTLVKFVVAFLLFLATVTCAIDVAMSYGYLVTNFGNFLGISSLSNALIPYPLMTGVTALVVQCFYGWRIQVLTGMQLLSYCIYALSIVQCLAAIGTTISGVIIRQFIHLDRTKAISLVWLIGSAVTDVLITASLVWYLRKGRTGFRQTDDVIQKIIRATVQTGLLTSALSGAVIIAFFLADGTPIHIALGIPISNLYIASLLSTLNARRGWVPLNRLHRHPGLSRIAPNSAGTVVNGSRTHSSPSIHFGVRSGCPTLSDTQERFGMSSRSRSGSGSDVSKVEFSTQVQFSPMSPSGTPGMFSGAARGGAQTRQVSLGSTKRSPGGNPGLGGIEEYAGDEGYVDEIRARGTLDVHALKAFDATLKNSASGESLKAVDSTTDIKGEIDLVRTQSTGLAFGVTGSSPRELNLREDTRSDYV